jgi:hypothetical protein
VGDFKGPDTVYRQSWHIRKSSASARIVS